MSIFDKYHRNTYTMDAPDDDNTKNKLNSMIYAVKALYNTDNEKLFNSVITQLYKAVTAERKKYHGTDDVPVYTTGCNNSVKLYSNGVMLVSDTICYNPNPSRNYTIDEIYNAAQTLPPEVEEKISKQKAVANPHPERFSQGRFMKNVINTVVKYDVPLITMLCLGHMLGLKPAYMIKYLSKTHCAPAGHYPTANDRAAEGLNTEALYTYETKYMNNFAEFEIKTLNHKSDKWYSNGMFDGHLPSYLKYLNIQQKSPIYTAFKNENGYQQRIADDLKDVNADYRAILAGLFTCIYGITSAKDSYYLFDTWGYIDNKVKDRLKTSIDEIMVPTKESLDRLSQVIKESNIKKELVWGNDVSAELVAYLEAAGIEYDTINSQFHVNTDYVMTYVPTANIPGIKNYDPYAFDQLDLIAKNDTTYNKCGVTGYDAKIETGNIYNILQEIASSNPYIAEILVGADIVDKDLSFRVNYDEECLIIKGDIKRHEITETSIDEVIDIMNDAYEVWLDASREGKYFTECSDELWNVSPSWKYKNGVSPSSAVKDYPYQSSYHLCINDENTRLDKTKISDELRDIIMYLASYRYSALMLNKKMSSISCDDFSEKYLQFSALTSTLSHILFNLQNRDRNHPNMFVKTINASDGDIIDIETIVG